MAVLFQEFFGTLLFLLLFLLCYNYHHLIQVPLLRNIYWKELSLLVYVWVAFLIVQIIKVSLRTVKFHARKYSF